MNLKNNSNATVQVLRIIFDNSQDGIINSIQVINETTGNTKIITGNKYRQGAAEEYEKYNGDEEYENARVTYNEDEWNDEEEANLKQFFATKAANMRDLANEIKNGNGEEKKYFFDELNDFFKTQVAHGGHILAYVEDKKGASDFENNELEDNKHWDATQYLSKIENGKLVFEYLNEKEKTKQSEITHEIAKQSYDEENEVDIFNDVENMLDYYKRHTLYHKAHVLFAQGESHQNSDGNKYFLLFQNPEITVLFQPIDEFVEDKKAGFNFEDIVYNKEYLNKDNKREAAIVDYVKAVKKHHQLAKSNSL